LYRGIITVRLTKSVGPILSYHSHDLVSEPCVRFVPIHFLASDKPTSPLLYAIATSAYGPMKGLLCGFDAELAPEGLVRGFIISFSIF
jgi:hypothetical protein